MKKFKKLTKDRKRLLTRTTFGKQKKKKLTKMGNQENLKHILYIYIYIKVFHVVPICLKLLTIRGNNNVHK